MDTKKAIRTIRQFIDRERTMRKRFLSGRSGYQDKIIECDGATAALDHLARQLDAQEPEAVNLKLFE